MSVIWGPQGAGGGGLQCGERTLCLVELSVITNMGVKGGLMTGVVEPCEPLRVFLAERRGYDYAD